MRTRLIATMLLACALLTCSLVTQPDETVQQTAAPPALPPSTGSPPTAAPPALPPSTGSPPTAALALNPYFGEQSIEERIAYADIVVKARLATTTSEVITATIENWSGNYFVAVRFHLAVSEYLKGSGASSITATAVWWNAFNTRQEAEAASPSVVARRDTAWDDREAILFISATYPDDYSSKVERSPNDHFLVYWTHPDDYFSLYSRYRKLWLPSAGTSTTGDDQEFLLAAPEPGKDTPTITIRELKSRIAAVNAEVNAGDGSEAYTDCIRSKYHLERSERYRMNNWSDTDGRHSFEPIWDGTFASGQPAGSEVYLYFGGLALPADKRARFWIDGRDAALFAVRLGDLRPNKDHDQDGQPDGFVFDQSVVSARPIPAGTYQFNHHVIPWRYLACEHTSTFAVTSTAVAPDGVLHEAFFDPVTAGATIAADGANGTLKPASFIGVNGATTTIERIAWEAGAVRIEISPHDGIAGHAMDFIALDGSVSLSLDVADAAVDAATDTLSWPVPSQPWRSGDTLMLRIREAPDCSTGAVTNASANPGLARDCEILLVVMDTLRGTGTLNWDVSSGMANWDGVTIGGSPIRVTRMELANEGLDGSIPEYLGRLLGLTHLDLSGNSLTGAIPAELSSLSNLEALRLSGNSLTGCIPVALMSVATNDLSSLDLRYCRAPAPENVAAGTPTKTSVALSWDPVAGAVSYRVEYRPATSTNWIEDQDNLIATSHIVDDLTCGTDYLFRVSALGVGTVYAPEWSEPSGAIPGATSECRTPTFGASSYSFGVREDVATTTLVGTVSATDPNDDAVTYTITTGSEDGKFDIDANSGAITVAAALDYETTPSYTLTVEASDANGNSATATVDIAVTDVFDDIAPAPGNVDVSLSAGTFTVTWDALTGAANYEAQYRTGGSGGTWTSVGTTATTLLTYSPAGGPECGTTYEFRVRSPTGTARPTLPTGASRPSPSRT